MVRIFGSIIKEGTESLQEDKVMKKKKNVISSDEVDFQKMIIPNADDIRRSVSKGGGLTVVFAKQSIRITVSNNLLETLGYPEEIQIAFQKRRIYIGLEETLAGKYYHLNYEKNGKKANIYNAKLVRQIIEAYGLDFEGRTSITFSKVKYIEKAGEIQGALIRIIQAE